MSCKSSRSSTALLFEHTLRVLAVALALLLAACGGGGGGGGGGGDGGSTTSLSFQVYLNESQYAPAEAGGAISLPLKAVGTVNDVQSVWLLVNNTTTATATWEELSFEALIGAYTRTVDGLNTADNYEFSAEAWNVTGATHDDVINTGGALKIFETPSPTVKAPLGLGALVVLNLSVLDDGEPFAFPRVSSIVIAENPMLPGAVTQVDITVTTADGLPVVGADESFDWTLGGDPTKGTFRLYDVGGCTPANPTVSAGTVDITSGNSEGTFSVCYQAPSAEGVYTRTVTVTNAAGDSTTVTFFLFADLSQLNSGILVYLPPAVVDLTAERTGTNDLVIVAAVVDDKPSDTVSYQWSFTPVVNPAFAGYTTFLPNDDTNPGRLLQYLPDVGGTISLTVTDADGASTLVTTNLAQNQFPDGVAPLGPYAAVEIVASYAHSCARLSGGNVACWGARANGRLGNGSTSSGNITSPRMVVKDAGGTYLNGITGKLSAGYDFNCAIDSIGAVYCWGEGSQGELGNGNNLDSGFAVPVDFGASPVPAIDVAAGSNHACAVLTGGQVKCWGDNTYNQMGNGSVSTGTDSYSPVASAISGADPSIASAVASGANFTCALMAGSDNAGQVWCWGRNYLGALGNGTDDISGHAGYSTPQVVQDSVGAPLTGVVAIAAGQEFACALTGDPQTPGDSRVHCWGYNAYGQLGIGSTTPTIRSHASPVLTGAAVELTDVTSVSLGVYHGCAVRTDNTVRCWAYNANGNLGDGTVSARYYGVQTHHFAGVDVFMDVAAGENHSCAILSHGNMRCWGYNANGHLGDGTTTSPRLWPVGVDNLPFLQ